jgi:hypothetical protein
LAAKRRQNSTSPPCKTQSKKTFHGKAHDDGWNRKCTMAKTCFSISLHTHIHALFLRNPVSFLTTSGRRAYSYMLSCFSFCVKMLSSLRSPARELQYYFTVRKQVVHSGLKVQDALAYIMPCCGSCQTSWIVLFMARELSAERATHHDD